MAVTELVIKIPEEEYRWIMKSDKTVFADVASKECMLYAIKVGTPLPKGHGRLIDADELKRIIQGNDVLYMTGFDVRICDINATPTIIEADKGESEEEE